LAERGATDTGVRSRYIDFGPYGAGAARAARVEERNTVGREESFMVIIYEVWGYCCGGMSEWR
jgi:hypothetical protein